MSSSIQPAITLLTPLLETAQVFFRRHSRTIIFTSLLSISTPFVVQNYRAYLALGRSAMPTPVGWLVALFAKPFGHETLSTAQYDRDPNTKSWLSDPDSIPERRGDRPKTGRHFLPHRQTTRIPPREMEQRCDTIMRKHAVANSSLVEITLSPHERVDDGLVVRAGVPSPHKVANHALREIVHIHRGTDSSLHVTLSPQDCKLVIERGWGERHPLSGGLVLPKEYLMIYAPRNEEELAVVERIIVAAIGYMTGSHNIL